MNQPTDDPQGRSADHATGLPEAEPRPLLSHMDASPTTDLLDRRQHAERNTPTPTTKPRPFSVAATRQLMSQLRERLRLERKSVTLSTVVREEDEEGIASNSDVDGYDAADESTQLLGDMSEHAVDMAVQDVDSDNDDEDVQNRSPYSSTPPFRDASKRLEQAPWKRVTKATLAFMFASALTFLVPIREQIGPMSHFAALAVLFFHPCKSVGAMLEATVTGLLGIAFAAAVSAGGILASQAVNEAVGAGHSASAAYYATAATVLVIVFSATFLLAFVRAKSSQSPVYTGTMVAHSIITVVLTRPVTPSSDTTLPIRFEWTALYEIVLPMLAGVAVSVLSNWLLWPVSASGKLRASVSRAISSFDQLLGIFVESFLLEGSQEGAISIKMEGDDSGIGRRSHIQQLMDTHNAQFIQLTQVNAESRLERLLRISSSNGTSYTDIIESMHRLTQHVGGMKSSVYKQDDMMVQRRLSAANIELLQSILAHLGPELKKLSTTCHRAMIEVDRVLAQSQWSRFWRPIAAYNRSMTAANHVRSLQVELDRTLKEFTAAQKNILQTLYQNERFDGRPNDEVFLVYYFVFCLMEFAKELRNGLLERVKEDKRREAGSKPWGWLWCCFGAPKLVKDNSDNMRGRQRRTARTHGSGSSSTDERPTSNTSASTYFDFIQSQTSYAFQRYLKLPGNGKHEERKGLLSSSLTATGQNRPEHPTPILHIPFFLRYRLRLWQALSAIGSSYALKFAFKVAALVTAVASFAFIPFTAVDFAAYSGGVMIISIVMTMTPIVGGTNLAGVLRILGTITGAAYSFAAWKLFPHGVAELATMLAVFAIPAFWALLYSDYPRVGQVALVTTTQIFLAQFANMYHGSDEDSGILALAWERGLMMGVGIVLGLLVTWYLWPYEARMELRKGVADLLTNMGMLYSRLVETFNKVDGQDDAIAAAMSSSSATITPATLHHYYYRDFQSTADTLAFFLSYEREIRQSLMRLQQLVPLTRLEPRLKGPFPTVAYSEMLASCQSILDNYIAMRVAISNNVSSDSLTFDDSDSCHSNDSESALRFPNLYQEDLILGMALPSEPSNGGPATSQKSSSEQPLAQHPELVPYRREMVGSVLLLFYVYSAALLLKQPLPTYLPPARESRKRLLSSMASIIYNKHEEPTTKKMATSSSRTNSRRHSVPTLLVKDPSRFISYYAYALSIVDVIEELEKLGVLLKTLFGEMFADIVAGPDHAREELLRRPGSSTEEVDLEICSVPESSLRLSGGSSSTSTSIPIHHHHFRADRFGSQRLAEIEGGSVQRQSRTVSVVRPLLVATPVSARTSGSFALAIDGSSESQSVRSAPTTLNGKADVKQWRSSDEWMV